VGAPDNEAPPSGPIVLDWNGTPIPHAYQQYTASFVATSSISNISFAFRHDPDFLGIDDVSVTTGGGSNLLVNGGFESGPLDESVPSGWTYLNEFEATFSGVVADNSTSPPGPHGGAYYYYDGSVQAYDVITQQIPTTIGGTYNISFWLCDDGGDDGGLNTFQRLSDNGLSGAYGNAANVIVYAGDSQPTWVSGLDTCIASIYEPGNIATDSGAIARPRYPLVFSVAVSETVAAAEAVNAAADYAVAIVEAAAAADQTSASSSPIYSVSVVEAAAAAATQSATLASAVMRNATIAGLSPVQVNSGVPPVKSSRLSSGTVVGA
jgi:hypothetical protein